MNVTRYLYAAAVGVTLFTTACNMPNHRDAKVQAQQRWAHVRGRVRYRLAQQQYEAAQLQDAVKTVTESIALDPNQADAYVLLARTYLELGKLASAQRALEVARRLELTSPDLCYMQGVILEQRNQFESATTMYARARTMNPANVDYLVAQAECLVALDRPGEALRLLDDNIDRLDDEGTVAALAAHVAVLLGDVDGASDRYRRALSAQSAARIPYQNPRGFNEAGEWLEPVGHDVALIAEELGRLLVGARRYDEALSVLSPLVMEGTEGQRDGGTNGGRGAVRRAVATCHLALGDPASAKAVVTEYAYAHPDDALAQLLLAKAAIATGDVLTALRAVDLVQQHAPNHPELWMVRAAVQWKRGRQAAAAADLYDVIQNNPNDVEAHCLLAEVLHAQQQLPASRTYFQRALKIDPGCAWARAGLESLRQVGPNELRKRSPKFTSATIESVVPADSQP